VVVKVVAAPPIKLNDISGFIDIRKTIYDLLKPNPKLPHGSKTQKV
jgi:hypothetical protein